MASRPGRWTFRRGRGLLLGAAVLLLAGGTAAGAWTHGQWIIHKYEEATADLVRPSRYRLLTADAVRERAVALAGEHGLHSADEDVEVRIGPRTEVSPERPVSPEGDALRQAKLESALGPRARGEYVRVEVRQRVRGRSLGVPHRAVIETSADLLLPPGTFVPTPAGVAFGALSLDSPETTPVVDTAPAVDRDRPGLSAILAAMRAHRDGVGASSHARRARVADALRVAASGADPWLGRGAEALLGRYAEALAQPGDRSRDPALRVLYGDVERSLDDRGVFVPPLRQR